MNLSIGTRNNEAHAHAAVVQRAGVDGPKPASSCKDLKYLNVNKNNFYRVQL